MNERYWKWRRHTSIYLNKVLTARIMEIFYIKQNMKLTTSVNSKNTKNSNSVTLWLQNSPTVPFPENISRSLFAIVGGLLFILLMVYVYHVVFLKGRVRNHFQKIVTGNFLTTHVVYISLYILIARLHVTHCYRIHAMEIFKIYLCTRLIVYDLKLILYFLYCYGLSIQYLCS